MRTVPSLQAKPITADTEKSAFDKTLLVHGWTIRISVLYVKEILAYSGDTIIPVFNQTDEIRKLNEIKNNAIPDTHYAYLKN